MGVNHVNQPEHGDDFAALQTSALRFVEGPVDLASRV